MDKIIYFAAGTFLGVIAYNIYNQKKVNSRIKLAEDKAGDKAWIQAHQNVEQLLLWGQQNNMTPMEILYIMKS